MSFKLSELSFDQKIALLRKAKELSTHFWVDELDCSKSFCRQKIEMSFDDAMKLFDDKAILGIYHRYLSPENHIEVSFRTMSSPIDYFLFLIVPVEKISELEDIH